MVIMVVCGVLLAAGAAVAVSWGGGTFTPPPEGVELTAEEAARRFAWYAALALAAGVIAGVLVIGAGGRLAMRLLAVTAGDAAQGQITEADEIVGRISVDGTIGFVLFNGIFGGVVFSGPYVILRRSLPPGRLGGAAYGLGLLVVLGTTLDPLRPENRDFDIVGPGWLAVVVFSALAVAFGLTLAAVTARLSRWLPLLAAERRVLVRYLGPAAVSALAFPITAALAVTCIVTMVATRVRPLVAFVRSRRWVLAGRVLMLVLVAVTLPHTVSSLVDIATR